MNIQKVHRTNNTVDLFVDGRLEVAGESIVVRLLEKEGRMLTVSQAAKALGMNRRTIGITDREHRRYARYLVTICRDAKLPIPNSQSARTDMAYCNLTLAGKRCTEADCEAIGVYMEAACSQ